MRRFAMCAACQAEYDDPRLAPLSCRNQRLSRLRPPVSRCGMRRALPLAIGHDALDRRCRGIAPRQDRRAQGPGRVPAPRRCARRCGRAPFARAQASPARSRSPSWSRTSMTPCTWRRSRRRKRGCSLRRRRRSCSCKARAISDMIAPSVAPDNPAPRHHAALHAAASSAGAGAWLSRSSRPAAIAAASRSSPTSTTRCDKLAGIADLFLVHDRPILQPVDDSVVAVIAGRETVLRCARGYAPLSLAAPIAAAPMPRPRRPSEERRRAACRRTDHPRAAYRRSWRQR